MIHYIASFDSSWFSFEPCWYGCPTDDAVEHQQCLSTQVSLSWRQYEAILTINCLVLVVYIIQLLNLIITRGSSSNTFRILLGSSFLLIQYAHCSRISLGCLLRLGPDTSLSDPFRRPDILWLMAVNVITDRVMLVPPDHLWLSFMEREWLLGYGRGGRILPYIKSMIWL
jgi:hypothetical protein